MALKDNTKFKLDKVLDSFLIVFWKHPTENEEVELMHKIFDVT